MSDEKVFNIGPGLSDGLTELLTSESPQARIFGRLVATGLTQTIQDFLQAEDARGTPRHLLLTAFLNQAANVVASIVISSGKPDAKQVDEFTEALTILFAQSLGTSLRAFVEHRHASASTQPPPTGAAS